MITENDDGAGPVISDGGRPARMNPIRSAARPNGAGSKPEAIGGEADGLDRVGRGLG